MDERSGRSIQKWSKPPDGLYRNRTIKEKKKKNVLHSTSTGVVECTFRKEYSSIRNGNYGSSTSTRVRKRSHPNLVLQQKASSEKYSEDDVERNGVTF
ncbi:unnamed protein product [Acanthoscelides obtectus]|uniref:Uncharacterized protein n=1 Tax=Acanthoscelides obtectus TaxID=200917 RepID=A0A9P0KGT7_ACAOB|nr:unnamed protein product [Acanthoscelides obtectus]CAK1646945.1 hypothetical protein AOBTE_LOCUS14964 [Acanthoscelides obtectus]